MSAASSPSFASDDERALAELIAAWESGGAAAVDAWLATRERERPGLRARFDALRATGLLDEPERRIDSFPERLGEFRLLARLGGGGMGVVYRARQESLGRDVALKLVRPDELYFPGARERFAREVRITAALSHPGIVPVYAHGDENGIPFFAMELVDGASLEDVLQSLGGAHPSQLRGADLFRAEALRAPPTGPAPERERLARLDWPRTVAELGLAAARALAHAHEHGVLHRDVKPSNLLLARDGRLLVADFGLASSSAASKLTRTRSQMGSLPYLAPELLAGAAASPRSDVYGLCVTLYELAALRPPYWNTDTVVLRDAILRGDALPLRRLEAGVPADLAAVIELGMDADPARRYAGPAELAADLQNALAHRPVRARPAGPLLVAQRWTARHPTRAVALAAAALIAVGAPSLIAWQQSQRRVRESALNGELSALNAQLSTVNDELAGVNAELTRSLGAEQASRARAERHFGEARDAVMTLLTRVAGEPTFREPALEPLRRDLYERAFEFQERFLAEAESSDDEALRYEAASSAYGAATLQQQFGDTAEAERTYARAIALVATLAPLDSSDVELVELAVRLACWHAAHELHAGRLEEAVAAREVAAQLCEHFASLGGQFAAARRLEALNLGYVALARSGRKAEALAAAQRMHATAVELARAETDPREKSALVERALAAAQALGTALGAAGRSAEGVPLLRDALALARTVEPDDTTRTAFAMSSALARLGLARVLDPKSAHDEAAQLERDAIDSLEAERARRPASFDVRRVLAEAHNNLGTRLAHKADGDAAQNESARQSLDRALELYRELHAQAPQVRELEAKLGACLVSRGTLELELAPAGDAARARDLLMEGVGLLEGAPTGASGLSNHGERIENGKRSLARAFRALGDDATADAVDPDQP